MCELNMEESDEESEKSIENAVYYHQRLFLFLVNYFTGKT